jgi:hypothetical protein
MCEAVIVSPFTNTGIPGGYGQIYGKKKIDIYQEKINNIQ